MRAWAMEANHVDGNNARSSSLLFVPRIYKYLYLYLRCIILDFETETSQNDVCITPQGESKKKIY
jgi:hypothetical protein